jgi:HK97 family phage prohead protease
MEMVSAGSAAEPAAVIRGYAALFGDTDTAGDLIEPGAFGASLRRRGTGGIRMLWQHDPATPIGVWSEIREDREGLFVEGRLALASKAGREAAELIAAGAIDGLSIGFRPLVARRGVGAARRRLVTIDLWEVSLVTFPMHDRARLSAPAFRRAAVAGRRIPLIAN